MKKKDVPLILLNLAEKFISNYSDVISLNKEENCYYSLKDKDEESPFFFKIFIEAPNGIDIAKDNEYFFEFSPESRLVNRTESGAIDYETLAERLDYWGDTLRGYNSIQSTFDDPILEASENEFFENYKVMDDDADTAPFNTKKLIAIDEYLEFVGEKLKSHKNGDDDESILKIEIEVQKLRGELTQITKNAVIKKLSKIWAKCQKQGVKLIKEMFVEAKGKIIKFAIEKGSDIVQQGFDLLKDNA